MTLEMQIPDTRSAKLAVRRPVVARLYLRGQNAPGIHRALKAEGHDCNLATVYRDIIALEAMWQKELVGDPVAAKARELAEYEE